MKRILICGTGRNGSTSIFKLLSSCKNTHVNHHCPLTGENHEHSNKKAKYDISIGPGWLEEVEKGKYDVAIFLYRDPREVVKSFMRMMDSRSEKEIQKYVEDYYRKAEKVFISDDRSNVTAFGIDYLNTFKGQKAIFDFFGIDEKDRTYLEDCWENRSK